MFDKENIQHNLKTGADSDVMFTREVTDNKSLDFNKLKLSEGIFKYPFLARSTGNSIKGMTESIESNELRKGRTKSASRRGNSSAEGSLDIELSPTTFDDNLEAAFRNKWMPWVSDTKSAINLDGDSFQDGFFMTRCTVEGEKDYNPEENFGKRRLLNVGGKTTDGLIDVPSGCVVHELTCGTEDIKYSVLKKFGGVKNEDLYQEFKHMAVNTFSLDVQIGAIVTGSFGFMGNNNPKLMNEESVRAHFGGTTKDRFQNAAISGNDYIDNLPVKSTDTDQFTSREGNLWINGKNITFAENLSMEINNGLEKKYALFVKNAISTQPLALDITGDLSTYLVEGESEDLYNFAIDDATNEIMFCFQDKEYDPTFIYVFQIFKSKVGDQDLSASGADTFSQSLPWSSFEERAVRVFRIALPKLTEIMFKPTPKWDVPGKIVARPNVSVAVKDLTTLDVTVDYKNEAGDVLATANIKSDAAIVNEEGLIVITEPSTPGVETAVLRDVKVNLNDSLLQKSFKITEVTPPKPVTNLVAYPGNKELSILWKDPDDGDFLEVEVDVVKGNKVIYSDKIAKGAQIVSIPKLANGTEYTIDVYAVDENDNKSTVVSTTVTPTETVTILKDLAGKKYVDETNSHYVFDSTARHCEMKYSAGTVNFDFNAADKPQECYIQSKDYADGKLLRYSWTGDVNTKITLTLVDKTLIAPMVPETINLTKE